MMFLPGLAVIFAGLVGGNQDVDSQMKKVLADLEVKSIVLPEKSVQKLTRYGAATRAVVRELKADGVIACEIVKGEGTAALRIVIYEGDGRLKTYSELPLTGKKLGRAQLEALRANLADEVAAMRADDDGGAVAAAAPASPPKPAPAPSRVAPAPAPAKVALAPTPAKVASVASDPSPAADADDEDPLNPGGRATTTTSTTTTTVAAADNDDAVSADEIAALTAAADTDDTPAAPARTLRLGAAAGIGVVTRTFRPGPSTVLPYSSSPVPSVVVDAHVQPTSSIRLAVAAEHTLQLSTPMSDGSVAATSISRWEATGTFSLLQRGPVDVGFQFGGARRAFAIQSDDPARSPDSEYNYVIAGLATTFHAGKRVVVRAGAAFQPVLWGSEPTEMALGEAVRWAFEVDGAVEVRATSHVFVRAAAQYQRFSWAWNMAGDRGDGGATDAYPTAVMSLGADY